jgi:uncharacterized membrane protein SpoIIM required for sporulation
MVLDWLVDLHKAEDKPWKMIILGFVYSSIAAGLAYLIFPREAGAVMLVLTIAAFMPLMLNLMKIEELKEETSRFLIKEHWPALRLFVFLFLGMVLAYVTLFIALPTNITNSLFGMQIDTITSRGVEMGAVLSLDNLGGILLNNFKVLIVGLLLALVFGAGAIFILDWNATILGVLIGGALKHNFGIGFAQYLIHGVPEIFAYFVAGLAGGIISVAIARHKIGTKQFNNVLKDSAGLIVLSVVILIIAALLEVFVSPLIG